MTQENKLPTPPEQKRTASQRLADVEQGLMQVFSLQENFVRDLSLIREALKLLDNKVSSIIQASVKGEDISDDTIDRIMLENNCDALAQKIKKLVDQNVLIAETQVSENSFVVGKETDKDGKVLNPRVQFALKSLQSTDFQAKLVGVKVGEAINLEDGVAFSVVESYKIQAPPAPEAPAVAPEVTPEAAPEAASV